MAEGPYELVGRLPTRVRFVSRYRALHRPLNRPVEFRFERSRKDPRLTERFRQELDELGRLDHPCFLPVLDRGTMRGRQGYVVPFREHRTVPELVKSKAFSLPKALACVRSLAAGLAAAHEAGFFLGPILPRYVAWDETAGGAYLLHYRVGTPAYMKRPKLNLPEDVRPGQPHSVQADVFHWGFFSYFLLGRGKTPYADGASELVPLRERCPQLSHPACSAVEAALSRDPGDRPGDGSAIQAVMQAAGLDFGLGAAASPGEGDEEAMEASAHFHAAVQDLGDLRGDGEAWLSPGEDPEEESPEDSTDDPGSDSPGEDAPDLGMFQSGGAPSMAGVNLPPPPEASASDAGASPVARSATPLLLGTGLAVGFLAVLTLTSPEPTPSAPPASADRPLFRSFRDDGSVGADGSIQPLAEAQAKPYRLDPLVRELMRIETVTPRLYPKVMQRLINLADRDGLPAAFQNPERLDDIGQLHRDYPEQACKELTKVLDDLRLVLGELR